VPSLDLGLTHSATHIKPSGAQVECHRVVTDRLLVSLACHCHISGDERELCGMTPGILSRGQRPVPCQLGRASALQVLGDLAVQRGAAVRGNSQVQRLAHQVVCERTIHNHTCRSRLDEPSFDVGLGYPCDTGQDADVRRTDHTGHLEQVERLLGQPGEPMLENLPHARWDRPCRRPAAHLQSCDLGGEERIAAGAPVHLGDVVLAGLRADDLLYDGCGRVPG
jgi:hypothetical protein